jgi:hypothetical protein
MRVLVACEYSGRVRDAFRALGHDAMSCDLLPTEVPGPHYQGDVFDVLDEGWDLMVAHPPCTYLANSSVIWLMPGGVRNEERWAKMVEGAAFFRSLWEAPIPRIAVENPIMHGHARRLIGAGATQTVQPWMFGEGETKGTCFWLKNLPPLVPTDVVDGRVARVHRMPPGPDRWKDRSRTYLGIAEAMAAQWSDLPAIAEQPALW